MSAPALPSTAFHSKPKKATPKFCSKLDHLGKHKTGRNLLPKFSASNLQTPRTRAAEHCFPTQAEKTVPDFL
ncbi:hypothetical protein [Corynebacterium pyruviciproducens]